MEIDPADLHQLGLAQKDIPHPQPLGRLEDAADGLVGPRVIADHQRGVDCRGRRSRQESALPRSAWRLGYFVVPIVNGISGAATEDATSPEDELLLARREYAYRLRDATIELAVLGEQATTVRALSEDLGQ
jgi:hypothetical protein